MCACVFVYVCFCVRVFLCVVVSKSERKSVRVCELILMDVCMNNIAHLHDLSYMSRMRVRDNCLNGP